MQRLFVIVANVDYGVGRQAKVTSLPLNGTGLSYLSGMFHTWNPNPEQLRGLNMTPAKTLKFPLGKFPIADMLGIKTLAYSVGHSTLSLEVRAKHLNPRGLVHGSVPFALADTGMALALYASRDEHYHNTEEWFATLEIKITYLRPVQRGRLVCDTSVIREGRRFAMLESEIAQDNILIAKASGTFAFASTPK